MLWIWYIYYSFLFLLFSFILNTAFITLIPCNYCYFLCLLYQQSYVIFLHSIITWQLALPFSFKTSMWLGLCTPFYFPFITNLLSYLSFILLCTPLLFNLMCLIWLVITISVRTIRQHSYYSMLPHSFFIKPYD